MESRLAIMSAPRITLTGMSFTFVDLFAGIGGFHGALSSLGGQAVYASEIDSAAAKVYRERWLLDPDGDIQLSANDDVMKVPPHDLLAGGFPCQPFSKSGKQRGMEEARGTLFYNIAKIIEHHRPAIVVLENVRNLAGPRHTHEWEVIIETLRSKGYRVSSKPLVLSPHRIHPTFGGRPQVRERIFIAATFVGHDHLPEAYNEPSQLDLDHVLSGWNPKDWDLKRHLPLESLPESELVKVQLSESEKRWLQAWDEFVQLIRGSSERQTLPGFPIWVEAWKLRSDLEIPANAPTWKVNFLVKNSDFYTENREVLDSWLKKWNNLEDFPKSRRKLEWQAQDAKSLSECLIHFRPSGLRVKKASYAPALVAITQTTVYAPERRRLTVRECARLQSFPDSFHFGDQPDSASYKQLGNGVNLSVVYHVVKALVERDQDLLRRNNKHKLLESIKLAPLESDLSLAKLNFHLN